ncbi:PAS domain S-box-containing protein/diguanylate cyclase (GGDEF) domain-containing protein [Candidatus Frackibacter sp. WG12]|nr:MAG: diguanylate cyclase and metal dependent phosphohydrolase [Candidatus Frackibacter sp. T328-2]SDB96152.1 PAS domain S-box-containing protein/diguanylate cyclase (GGDEF) domain-containing protein [Candidatus Frackibacter sp. WG11]SEM27548.1 PAS domain S-box-containing protein/diguanylate cyclase (GGDEF) domain-containing protein [Candidatus Frackibacter sp. WG12]SFL32344.1 PAS domain S-box-containing protein/diguanylate cyclase (GGDEF) domain-containing protein [Candidatus Frackibacter sp.
MKVKIDIYRIIFIELFGIIVIFLYWGLIVIQGSVNSRSDQQSINEKINLQLAAMNATMDGIAIHGQDEKIIYSNEAHAKMYGYIPEDLIGEDWRRFYDSEEVQRFEEEIMPKFFSEGQWRGEAIGRRIDGSKFPQELSLTLLENSTFICILRDITKRKEAEKRVKYLSLHDKVTGLYNRVYFEEELERLDTKRQLPLSLIIGDMNGLKLVNDAFGHMAGDQRLKRMAEILKSSCRQEDIIARWGGDEFTIILPKTDSITADGVCKRIKEACSTIKDDGIPMSIALGAATKEDLKEDIYDIFEEAEDRMYRNKLMNSSSARHEIISSLQKTLLEKDYETEAHARRLKQLVIKFGNKLGFTSDTLDKLSLLATLHDIGKVAISDRILNKQKKLSQEDWREIRRHPEIGYRIAQASDNLTSIADEILAHHEWWNGKGYPQGLKGDEIPFLARIISIIDSYDVMTNNRPYRKAVSHEKAIKELRRNAGIQFDPYLTEEFIELIK